MSGEVEVVPDAIRNAAASVEDAASGVGSHVPSEVAEVGDAMPGSVSAGTATELAGAWRQRFRAWETDAEAHAEAMRGCAASWTEADHLAAAAQLALDLANPFGGSS